ncbi:XdhC family protein [Variovorax robiniae]|uniref:XdhC family protein n=1 Tax=Variovorax robiniae TaxID=1836199 RepID=A0ABU8XHA2_9BURK
MDNVDLSVLKQVLAWREDDHRVVLGTITRTWGSAPRPIGSVVAVRGDGRIVGSVSGGCIEDDLIEKVRHGALGIAKPEIVRYGVGAEEAARFGLPCGGTLELVLEPIGEQSRLAELVERLARGELVRRELRLHTGEAMLKASGAGEGDVLQLTETTLATTHGPRWRLLLIGAGQMTEYIATMARTLDYEVIVCDPRDEYAEGFCIEGARLVRGMPDDVVADQRPDGHTAVIALTHDPKLDDLALLEALCSPAFYVGAIGSRANQAKRKQRLKEYFGVTEEQLERLHGPVGIKNGARTPPEIAVSILAQLTATRYGYVIPEPVQVVTKAPGVEAGCTV